MSLKPKGKNKSKRQRMLRVITLVALLCFFAGIILVGGISIYSSMGQRSPSPAPGSSSVDTGKAEVDRWIQAEKTDPNDPFVLRSLAQALMAEGENDPAREALEKAVKLSPRDYLNQELMGQLDFFEMKFEDAAAEFQNGLKLKPGDSQLEQDLAMAQYLTGSQYKKRGKKETAREWFKKALSTAVLLKDKKLEGKIRSTMQGL